MRVALPADVVGLEHLASQLALSGLQQLNISRMLAPDRNPLPDGVFWVGHTPVPTPLVASVATLHRMAHR